MTTQKRRVILNNDTNRSVAWTDKHGRNGKKREFSIIPGIAQHSQTGPNKKAWGVKYTVPGISAIYLHSRVVASWKGRPTAVISIIGFLSVIFTCLGVNVFLSGPHSYASASIMWKLIGAAILNI